MESTSNGVLIDPSLILAKNSIRNTFHLVEKSSTADTRFKFFYPASLRRLIQRDDLSVRNSSIKFFLQNAYPSDIGELRTGIKEYSDILSGFELTLEHREKYGQVYEALYQELYSGEELFSEDIANILFEEWVFLNEHSWVVSRIKKPFNRFVTAGSICLQFGNRTVDLLIRKTLKMKNDELISKVDKLRAFGKWIAVGGPSALGVINPIIPVFAAPVAGYFLLFDPELATNSP